MSDLPQDPSDPVPVPEPAALLAGAARFLAQSQPGQALAWLEAALGHTPDGASAPADSVYWGARYWLSVAHVQREEYAQAEPLLAAITAHVPQFPGGHFYHAQCLEHLGRVDEAVTAYQRLIALDPRDFRAHYFVGCLYAATGRYDLARREVEALEELQPEFAGELDETLRFCAAMDRLSDPAGLRLLERYLDGPLNVEVFQAASPALAREFLALRDVHKTNYQVIVRTPGGPTLTATPTGIEEHPPEP